MPDFDYDVLVLGEILWDCVDGSRKPAGAPFHFARHLKKCGAMPYLVSAVGQDDAGDALIQAVVRSEVAHAIPYVGAWTGQAEVVRLENGGQTFRFKTPAAWDDIQASSEVRDVAESVGAVYFGTLAQRAETSRRTIREIVSSFSGKWRICDINLRPPFDDPEVLRWSMRHCDVLKFSLDEVGAVSQVLFGSRVDNPSVIAQACMAQYGIHTVIETLGEFGAKVWTADDVYAYERAPGVEVVSTVGAGDAFLASFMAAVIHDIPVKTALRMAVAYAARVVSQDG